MYVADNAEAISSILLMLRRAHRIKADLIQRLFMRNTDDQEDIFVATALKVPIESISIMFCENEYI